MRPMPGITMTVRTSTLHLNQCNSQQSVLREIKHQDRVTQLMTNWYVRCRQSDQQLKNHQNIYKQYQMNGGMTMAKRTLVAAIFAQFEMTFMRYGNGLNCSMGITFKPNTLKTWALSLHNCSVLANDIYDSGLWH